MGRRELCDIISSVLPVRAYLSSHSSGESLVCGIFSWNSARAHAVRSLPQNFRSLGKQRTTIVTIGVKKAAIAVGTLAVVVLTAGLLLPTVHYDGMVVVNFRFKIVESGSSRPIRDATIQIIPDWHSQNASGTNVVSKWSGRTDSAGNTLVTLACGAGWTTSLFGKTGKYVIRHQLLVEANGYRPFAAALTNVLGGEKFPISKRVFDLNLALSRNP